MIVSNSCKQPVKPLGVVFKALALGATLWLGGCVSLSGALNGSPTLGHAGGILSMSLKDLKKRYANSDSKFINLNGVDIHYRDVGEGDAIVLVHGMMSSLQTWDGWAKELEKSYRVIRLDVPGFGLTGAPELVDRLSHRFMIDTFDQFIDYLKLEKFDLAGNSIGGLIAAAYAAKNPAKVTRLILLNPVAYPQDVPWIFKFATMPVIRDAGQYVQPPLLITMNVADAYGDADRIEEVDMRRYVHMALRPGAKAAYIQVLGDMKALAASEHGYDVGGVNVPTLLMWGGNDNWTPVELASYWMRDLPDAKLKIYPEAGHMPMEEFPEDTVQDALTFLNDQPVDGVTDTPAIPSVREAKTEAAATGAEGADAVSDAEQTGADDEGGFWSFWKNLF